MASLNSTVGDLLPPSAIVAALKAELIRSPSTFPVNGVHKPCMTLVVMGDKGDGKTTFLNSLASALFGSPCDLFRTGAGLEAQVSTTSCTLIPFHKLLWPNTKDEDVPCMFYVWDTVGLTPGENLTPANVATYLDSILDGDLPNHSGQISQRGRRGAQGVTPMAQAVIICKSANNMDKETCATLRVITKYCSEVYPARGDIPMPIGIPVFILATKTEVAIKDLRKNYTGLPTNPKVHDLLSQVSEWTGAPFQRCFVAAGLNTLRCTQSSNPNDVRESILLTLVYNAVREISMMEQYNSCKELQRHVPAEAKVIPKSIIYTTTAELCAFLTPTLPSAVPFVKENDIDGQCLVSMSDADIREVFGAAKSYGLIQRIIRLVEPYRTPIAATTATGPSLWQHLSAGDVSASHEGTTGSAFRATKTTAHAQNATGPLVFQTVTIPSPDVAHNGANFTLKKGTYQVHFSGNFTTMTGNDCILTLKVSGVLYSQAYHNDANGFEQTISHTDIVHIAADNTVVHYAIQGSQLQQAHLSCWVTILRVG